MAFFAEIRWRTLVDFFEGVAEVRTVEKSPFGGDFFHSHIACGNISCRLTDPRASGKLPETAAQCLPEKLAEPAGTQRTCFCRFGKRYRFGAAGTRQLDCRTQPGKFIAGSYRLSGDLRLNTLELAYGCEQ